MPEQKDDWFITSTAPTGSDVLPDVQQYRLLNRTTNRKIRYGERSFGINLDWGLTAGATNIRFGKLGGDGPLRYGDSVAIFIGGGGYLRQHYRAFGVDLVWSSTPVYHWRIYGACGTYGSVIKTNEEISIYSKTYEASLVHWVQIFGINLGWWIPRSSVRARIWGRALTGAVTADDDDVRTDDEAETSPPVESRVCQPGHAVPMGGQWRRSRASCRPLCRKDRWPSVGSIESALGG